MADAHLDRLLRTWVEENQLPDELSADIRARAKQSVAWPVLLNTYMFDVKQCRDSMEAIKQATSFLSRLWWVEDRKGA